jgi:deazaflavin-dependent oxidoreductase (nitroreductase family)
VIGGSYRNEAGMRSTHHAIVALDPLAVPRSVVAPASSATKNWSRPGQRRAMNPVTRKAIQAGTKANVWLYRRTNGRLGGQGMGRLPLLLLTVPGRKSGRPHTVPIAYFDHNGDYIVVGTGMGGSKRTPQWLLNLKAAGKGHIRIREREHDVNARLTSDAERDELWPQIAALAPHFAKFQARTGRKLPIVVLTAHSSMD